MAGRGPILVADDDACMRRLLVDLVESSSLEAVAAEDGEQALASARRRPPLVAVLDVNLPLLSGYEVCRALRAEFGSALPILFLSGERVESYDRVAGLLLGADDYVVKPFAPDELLARILAMVRRADGRPKASSLTARELEVLRLLAGGLEQREIAHELVITPKTVATHIERILPKLGARSRAQAVAVAYREGFVSTPA